MYTLRIASLYLTLFIFLKTNIYNIYTSLETYKLLYKYIFLFSSEKSLKHYLLSIYISDVYLYRALNIFFKFNYVIYRVTL